MRTSGSGDRQIHCLAPPLPVSVAPQPSASNLPASTSPSLDVRIVRVGASILPRTTKPVDANERTSAVHRDVRSERHREANEAAARASKPALAEALQRLSQVVEAPHPIADVPPRHTHEPPRRVLDVQPDDAPSVAELCAAIGYKSPDARALEHREELAHRKAVEREEAKAREQSRQLIREQLGQWTKDARERFKQLQPLNAVERTDVRRLGQHVWAICRQTVCGSLGDLAYAVQQMTTRAPLEAVGCWVVEAMGMTADGVAVRQLYSTKARRKLARSFAQWMAGENMRLRDVAGSPSRRTVRGCRRVPQTLLARITAAGDRPWHRSTTTRDANEAHAAGLWRRVRMRRELAHESERCGSSQQVVSRYWMELPRQPRRPRRTDTPVPLGAFWSGAGLADAIDSPLEWVAEHAKHAIVYAMHSVRTARLRLLTRPTVGHLMSPLVHAPP